MVRRIWSVGAVGTLLMMASAHFIVEDDIDVPRMRDSTQMFSLTFSHPRKTTILPYINIDKAHAPPKPLRNYLRAHSGSSTHMLTTLSLAFFFHKKCDSPLP